MKKSWLRQISISLVLLLGAMSSALAEPFTADHLVALSRVGAPGISPDGTQVVFTLRTTDMTANKGRYDLWLASVHTGQLRQLTSHQANDTDPVWSADGRKIFFLSNRAGGSQVWQIPIDGGEARAVTNLAVDVTTFRLSPDNATLIFSAQVFPDCETFACSVVRQQSLDESTTSGAAYSQLFMRHWDHWLSEKRSELFALKLIDGVAEAAQPTALTNKVNADVPSRVWGGKEEYAISPDGTTVYFAARLRNAEEPTSTNFDLYSALINGDGKANNLTRDNRAWDTQPVLSPDGKSLAWLAMSRPGFEADRFQIKLRDLRSGKTRTLASDWDRSPSSIVFSPDGRSLFVNAQDLGHKTLWQIDLDDGQAKKRVAEGYVSALDVSSTHIIFAKDDLKRPSELFALPLAGGEVRQLTQFSASELKGVELGDFEQFSFKGAGGDQVYGYVVKPAGFKTGQQYPIAFLIHGGPQGSFSNHFHYRWNPQTYAGQGFAAVFIDFHGSTGYGQAFTDAISGDWGGAPLVDLQLGLASALKQYSFLDGDRVCALGASYGGYMINWIAGNWPDRFDCLVNHDGVFDTRSMYYTTEELWFPEWENGGPQFAEPENYEKHNPVNYVSRWKTPMLVVHGELDYRVPVTQGIAAFTALQRQGIDSRFLYFPDENHWVLKPSNSVQWHNEVNHWLHRYLDK
ncbi:MAG: prolyl oligopeptidase family serine peptidase [Lysobacterales bacterium]